MKKSLCIGFLIGVLAAGCTGGNRAAQQPQQPPPGSSVANVSNPTGFPLYSGSKILVSKGFKQVVDTNASGNGVLSQGNGTYNGNELIASASAPFSTLQTWLNDSYAKPPSGFRQANDKNLNSSSDTAQTMGIDGRGFQFTKNGKPSTLLVVVMDPSKFNARLGPALALIRQYRNMPSFMRGPIDDKVKAQTGFSVSEMLQPDSPLGLALDAMNEFSHNNQRAILMIDAQRE
ncbi:MAG: hypothetical protein JO024_01880 [Candidatus Eremiobacteraeota bacterium]|nr:hypothetical protein [Candidatus Eremiobacteraeota bacterium]